MSTKKKPEGSGRRLWSVEIEQREDGVHFHVPPPEPTDPSESDAMPINPAWQYLSPLTLRAVRLLCSSGWLTREEIADKLGEQPDGDLRPLLSDLVKRGILESSPRRGYMIAMPDSMDPETYKKALAEWLDCQSGDANRGNDPP